ncbi:hypothetical protein SNE40_011244 [Patella caerulea]|uniref:Uncharacterized protein n=1 Tax=Patella caerulea TaxID=87958 RepID=A0AAN8JMF6_PATCE
MADNGEIYDDGTNIKNISVSGVAQKAAMFEPNSNKTTPPVLRRLRQQQQQQEEGTAGKPVAPNKPNIGPKSTTENNLPPWVAKKQISNGNPPDNKTSSGPTSPVSPKTPPNIPNKAKWSPAGSKTADVGTKPTGVNVKPYSYVGSNIPPKTTPHTPVRKDINDNVKSVSDNVQPNITKGTKRASVTDMMKNFQAEKGDTASDTVITKVGPLKDSKNINTTEKYQEHKLESIPPPTSPKKTSIQERIAALKKDSIDESSDPLSLRKGPNTQKPKTFRQSVIKRNKDNKEFKHVNINSIQSSNSPPRKPSKLTDIDLTKLKDDFKKLLMKYGNKDRISDIDTGEFDDIYDDVGNVCANDRPVSIILPMTEEEEYDDIGNTKASDPAAGDDGETYDDCGVGVPDPDEIYEPLDEEEISGGSAISKSKDNDKETAERKKREEKERKEQEKKEREEKKKKEKEEKDRQKEQKKKEKEEKDRMAKLKVDGSEKKLGEGIIREDGKSAKLDLAVKKGDMVTIIRMDNNPKGKWLVTNKGGKWGYVDADNVEVATPTIRQMMNSEECYMVADDFDGNGGGVDDELYEEV